jgi:F0F1-type ATP synthase membrane subunit b/b'
LLKEKAEQEKEKKKKKKQVMLDRKFEKLKKLIEYTRDNVLHAVAQFIMCDDQVRLEKAGLFTY